MVACRGELVFAVSEKRKNRESHLSQRNGRKQITARIIVSIIPLRLDGWIRTLVHLGQFIIAILLTPFRRTDVIIGLNECQGLSRFEQGWTSHVQKRTDRGFRTHVV